MTQPGPLCRVFAPGTPEHPEALLVAVADPGGEGFWYEDGWDARAVERMLTARAEEWRIGQSFVAGDALDDEQVTMIEATRDFYAELAAIDEGEPPDVDRLEAIIERMNRSVHGVILEEKWVQDPL